MRQKIAMALACAWMTAATTGAAAGEVYRCGDSYSSKPCPGGRAIEVTDTRSASEAAQARQAAQRDAKTADAMEKARLKEEAKPAPVVVLSGKTINQPAEAPKPAASAKGKSSKGKKPADFKAVDPKSR